MGGGGVFSEEGFVFNLLKGKICGAKAYVVIEAKFALYLWIVCLVFSNTAQYDGSCYGDVLPYLIPLLFLSVRKLAVDYDALDIAVRLVLMNFCLTYCPPEVG